jgi:hypothetical protein
MAGEPIVRGRSRCGFNAKKVVKSLIQFVICLVLTICFGLYVRESWSLRAGFFAVVSGLATLASVEKLLRRYGCCPACGELNEAVKEGESRACANKACQVELRGNSQELWVAASEAVGGAVITHH